MLLLLVVNADDGARAGADVLGTVSHLNPAVSVDAHEHRTAAAGGGVLLYLRSASGVPVDTMEHTHEDSTREETREAEWKEIGVGAQIDYL